MKKKTDAQLFKELRRTSIIIGVVIVVSYFILTFTDSFSSSYNFIILLMGIFSIIYGSQKYIQEHPKVRIALMWILIILALLGVLVFFMYTKTVG